MLNDYTDHPPTLFKYRSFDKDGYYKNAISKNEIFFSSPANFNDPFDCRVFPNYETGSNSEIKNRFIKFAKERHPELTEVVQKEIALKAYQRGIKDIRNKTVMEKKLNDITESMTGICSFSEIKDNLLMWAHYSDSHTGFCIEYDFNEMERIAENYDKVLGEKLIFFKVRYESFFPKIDPYTTYLNEDLNDWIKVKSIDWKYENEWRLLYAMQPNKCIQFPNSIVKAVYFGINCLDDNKSDSIKLIKERADKIPLFQAVAKDKEFSIKFEKINY